MEDYSRNQGMFAGRKFDWWTIAIYFVLVAFGWFSIYSASYSGEEAPFYDVGYRYGMQLVWIGVSVFAGIILLLMDARYYFDYAHVIYIIGAALMLLTVFIGKEINGAKSWLSLGPASFQPVEFMKLGTALLLARVVSLGTNSENEITSVLRKFVAVITVPVALALAQNDMGSAMVFFIFFVVLYREGLNFKVYSLLFLVGAVLVLSFVLDRELLLFLIFLIFLGIFAYVNDRWKLSVRYAALFVLAAVAVSLLLDAAGIPNVLDWTLVVCLLSTLPLVYFHTRKHFKDSVWKIIGTAVAIMSICFLVDVVFDNVLKPHQQMRILDLFGICDDPKGISYNVTQSKIAIGSGGLAGRGFRAGTQTQYSYVPEQETDFIFCTVGEEEGFIGTSFVVVLFTILVIRLMMMGERTSSVFVRIYSYCVAGIFFFHFVINISMTIGLFPVVGIPLPFFSYGGSSFLCFTLLLFVALRLDSEKNLNNF